MATVFDVLRERPEPQTHTHLVTVITLNSKLGVSARPSRSRLLRVLWSCWVSIGSTQLRHGTNAWMTRDQRNKHALQCRKENSRALQSGESQMTNEDIRKYHSSSCNELIIHVAKHAVSQQEEMAMVLASRGDFTDFEKQRQ